jgi:hypothetical protein
MMNSGQASQYLQRCGHEGMLDVLHMHAIPGNIIINASNHGPKNSKLLPHFKSFTLA